MEYKENINHLEKELRDDPMFDLVRDNRPQPPLRSLNEVRRTLDRIETPPLRRLGTFARRAPVAFAAACVAMLLLVTGTAYAVAGWIHRDDYKPGDYLGTPPEQRTETSVIPEMERVVKSAAPKSEDCRILMIPEMSDGKALDEWRVKLGQPKYSEADWAWVRQIRPEIQEVLYDGTTLAYTIRLNTDHALAFRYWEEPGPQELEPMEEELQYADSRQSVKTVNRSTGIVQESWDQGGITLHTEHDLNGPLEGSGRVSFVSTIAIQDLNVDDMAHIGCLAMIHYTFSFDLDGALAATNADTRVAERPLSGNAVLTMDFDGAMWNQPVSLDGVVLEETASFRSTGVYLSYRVKAAPADWTAQMRRSLLAPTNEKGKFEGMSVSYTLGGDETVYEPSFPEVTVQNDGTLAYTVILPLFPSDYEALKQRGVTIWLTLHTVDSFNGQPTGDTWQHNLYLEGEDGFEFTTSARPLISFPLDLP